LPEMAQRMFAKVGTAVAPWSSVGMVWVSGIGAD
jgi:hypothetical protein